MNDTVEYSVVCHRETVCCCTECTGRRCCDEPAQRGPSGDAQLLQRASSPSDHFINAWQKRHGQPVNVDATSCNYQQKVC